MISQIMNKTGVYLFKDEAGKVLYVGKAKSFKNRLKSHNHLPVEVYEKHVTTEYREEFDDEKRDSLEKRLILKHNPPFNQMNNTVFCKFNEVPDTILANGKKLFRGQYLINTLDRWTSSGRGGAQNYAIKRFPISFRPTTDGDVYFYSSPEGVKNIERVLLNRWRWELLYALSPYIYGEYPHYRTVGEEYIEPSDEDRIQVEIKNSITKTLKELITEEFDEINPSDPWAVPRKP